MGYYVGCLSTLDLKKEDRTRNETKAPTPDGWRVRSDRLK